MTKNIKKFKAMLLFFHYGSSKTKNLQAIIPMPFPLEKTIQFTDNFNYLFIFDDQFIKNQFKLVPVTSSTKLSISFRNLSEFLWLNIFISLYICYFYLLFSNFFIISFFFSNSYTSQINLVSWELLYRFCFLKYI
jgi:hypothetical protein